MFSSLQSSFMLLLSTFVQCKGECFTCTKKQQNNCLQKKIKCNLKHFIFLHVKHSLLCTVHDILTFCILHLLVLLCCTSFNDLLIIPVAYVLCNQHRKHSKQLKTSMDCLPSQRSPLNPSLWPTTTIRCPLYSGSLAMPYSMPAPYTDFITSPGKCARTLPQKRCRGKTNHQLEHFFFFFGMLCVIILL